MNSSECDELQKVRACRHCAAYLPHEPRPVLQWSPSARILIAGQAPGRKVHDSGVPFADASGERLRQWLGLNPARFYDPGRIAILPMGFCFPGTGRSGDLPPRPECAPLWREQLLEGLVQLRLTLVIGQYAMDWHLQRPPRESLTATVARWREFGPRLMPLPHPSPRNNIWLKKNPWFAADLLPELQKRVTAALHD